MFDFGLGILLENRLKVFFRKTQYLILSSFILIVQENYDGTLKTPIYEIETWKAEG